MSPIVNWPLGLLLTIMLRLFNWTLRLLPTPMSRIINWTLSLLSTMMSRWHFNRTLGLKQPRLGRHESKSVQGASLSALPNELLLAILAFLDASALSRMAAVSRRCHQLATYVLLSLNGITLPSNGTGGVVCDSSDSLRALRLALALPSTSTKSVRAFEYVESLTKTSSRDVSRIKTLLRHFGTRSLRLHSIALHFSPNIVRRWSMRKVAPQLLVALCGDSKHAVVVVRDGLVTCRVKDMQHWKPHPKQDNIRRTLHDKSSQLVPTISSVTTLHAKYPVCTGISAHNPWTLVVVDQARITSLVLSLKLQRHEWAAILGDLTLPNLQIVEVLGNTITPASIDDFLNRHALKAITFLSPRPGVVRPDPMGTPALVQPSLYRVRGLAHYVDYILTARPKLFDSAIGLFPMLTHIELWPDEYLPSALNLLSLHAPLVTRLVLWSFEAKHFPYTGASDSWPVFQSIETLSLTKCALGMTTETCAQFATLLKHSFPALSRLEMSFSFSLDPAGGNMAKESHSRAQRSLSASRIGRQVVSSETQTVLSKQDFVRELARENRGIVYYEVDGEVVNVQL
ncbi:hypothetical protein C8F01DRAFT_1080620 [Mycena amicta]|nr:hypothetical protein C8F01DRAFT_1080620 [Mycena amicta]